MKTIISTVFILFINFNCNSQPNNQQTKAVYLETKKINDASLTGHIEQNVDKIVQALHDKVILLPPGASEPIIGLENAKNYYLSGFSVGRSLEIQTSLIDYQVIDQNHTVEVGSYSIKYQEVGKEKPIIINGNMLIFWERDKSGSWKIKVDMWH